MKKNDWSSAFSFLYKILFLVTPLLFTSFTDEVFEFPKMIFIYFIASLIFGVYFFKIIYTRKLSFQKHPLNLTLLLIGFLLIITSLNSLHPFTSFFGYYSRFNGSTFSLLIYLFLSFIFLNELNPKEINKIFKMTLLPNLLIALYALLQKMGIDRNYWVEHSWERVFSTLGQPNWLASYLLIFIPYYFFQGLKKENKTTEKIIFFFASFLLTLSTFFTRSAAGYLSLGFIFIFIITYFILKKVKSLNLKILIFSLAFILLLITGYSYQNQIKETFWKKETNQIRLIVWQGTFDLIRQKPILGYGPETFAYSFLEFRPESLNYTSEWNFLFNKPHNEYLEILAESGLLGFSFYLYFIIFPFIYLLKNKKQIQDHFSVIGFALGFIALLITLFFGFQVALTNLYFFIIPLILLSLSQKTPEKITLQFLLSPFLKKIILLTISLFIFSFNILNLKNFLANIAFENGNYIKAVSLNPYQNTYTRYLALYYAKDKNLEKSLEYLEKAYQQNPHNYLTLQTITKTYYELSLLDPQFLIQAQESAYKQTQLSPNDPKAWYEYGLFLISSDEKEKGKETLEKALELKNDYADPQEILNTL